jgi:hypothetical protein
MSPAYARMLVIDEKKRLFPRESVDFELHKTAL